MLTVSAVTERALQIARAVVRGSLGRVVRPRDANRIPEILDSENARPDLDFDRSANIFLCNFWTERMVKLTFFLTYSFMRHNVVNSTVMCLPLPVHQ